jgi:hypothetical protein
MHDTGTLELGGQTRREAQQCAANKSWYTLDTLGDPCDMSLTPLQLQQTSILAGLDLRRLSSKSRPSKPAASNPAAWHEATSQAVRWPVEVLESRHPLRLEPHLPPLGREMPVPPVHVWPNSPPDQQPLTALRPPMAAKWCAPQEHSAYPAMQL